MTTTDDVFSYVGDFGKFQKIVFILICFVSFVTEPFMMMSVFIMGVPEHRCKIANFSDDTFEVQNVNHRNMINRYIPLSDDVTKTYDECHMYVFDSGVDPVTNSSRPSNATLTKCSSWVYSKEYFTNTFVSEMSLVCDSKYRASLSKTIFFGGVLIGSLGFGLLSDIIGRRKTLLLTAALLFVFSMTLSLSINYTMYVIMRFLVGMSNLGHMMTGFVILMEWVGPSKRKFVGIVSAAAGTVGELYLALTAYLIRQWKYTEISLAGLLVVCIIYWWMIPESPRWLVENKKLEEAKHVLKKVAKVNKKQTPEKALDDLSSDDKKDTGKLWLLFTSRVLTVRTVIIFFNWMVVSMSFYGLSLNVGKLYGDFYVNFLISTLMEFPGAALPYLVMDRFGRRKSHSCFMSVGGLACLATILTVSFGGTGMKWMTTVLAMVGKCFATAAFNTLYIYSVELYPTVVRNAGMGASSCWARVGGMVSPFIADTAEIVGGKVGRAVPLVVFGAASLIAGVLTLLLPETFGETLPDTIEDCKNFSRKKDRQTKELNVQAVEIFAVETMKS